MIHEESGNSYHILLQTNLAVKLLMLSYSNNFSVVFNKTAKPKFLLMHSLKEINRRITSIQITALAIKCIVDWLNYCSEDYPR